MLDQVTVFTQSSIRLAGSATLYFDPFQMTFEPHDADAVLITHDHYDHFSPEDFRKVMRDDTVFAAPELLVPALEEAGIPRQQICPVAPGGNYTIAGVPVQTVAAYNVSKPYHPREKGWVGYVADFDGMRYFVSGDTDRIPEHKGLACDVALVPIGGTFTMDADEAAELINALAPKVAAIPTHYGTIVGAPSDADRFAQLVDPRIPVVRKIVF